tara:strand:- start:2329 stop:3696 length:1368 start_codon:yes stop_codon:yes gene_type:complete
MSLPHHSLPVWVYWESDMPPIIQLCVETMDRHLGDQFHLITPASLRLMGGGHLLELTETVSKAYRSDLIRLWLIKTYGGVWMDADTIVVNRLPDDFIQAVETGDLVGVYNQHTKKGWGADGMIATPFGAKKDSQVIQFCFDTVLAEITAFTTRGKKISYGSTSVGILSRAYKRFKDTHAVTRFKHWRLHRIPWFKSGIFNSKCADSSFKSYAAWNDNVCAYHLTNKVINRWKGKTRGEILKSGTFLAGVFGRALGLTNNIAGHTHSLLDRIPLKGECHGVEVGCLTANSASNLLQQRPDLHLTMVDPWATTDANYKATGDHMVGWDVAKWNTTYKIAMDKTDFAKDRRTVLRGRSVQMAASVDDHSMDFVFIDACHSYEGAKEDINTWVSKVKEGGYISGHDINHPRDGKKYGVTKAVKEFLAANPHLTLELGLYYSWFIKLEGDINDETTTKET